MAVGDVGVGGRGCLLEFRGRHADALGRTVIACRENEASSRGGALLALERLGVIGHVRELPARMGRAFEPVPEHRRIYEEELGRQRRLYTILFEQDG